MVPTLKNIKRKLSGKLQIIFQNKTLDFENKDILIQGKSYFLCRNVISTIPEMVAVEQRATDEEDAWNYNTFALRMHDQHKALYFGLRHKDKLVGFIGCRVNSALTRMRIMKLSVLPGYKSEGIANFLVSALLKKAAFLGIRSVFIQVRADYSQCLAFYAKMGFQVVQAKNKTSQRTEVVEYQYLTSKMKEK